MTSPDHLGTTPPLQDPTMASPWVPLWRIIEQIASAIGDSQEAEYYAKTRHYIRQVAAEGRLRIRGRHEIEVVGQERTIFGDVYTDIPSAYWKYSVINILATGAAFEADRHTDPEKTPYAWGPKGLYEPNCYTGLQLNSDGLSQLIGDLRDTSLLADAQISEKEEWITAASAVTLLGMNHFAGTRAICKRAHAGSIKARAQRFIRDERAADNVDIPVEFWWAEGGAALHQNWASGDFDTWIDHQVHLEAFGVTFRRSDIEEVNPTPAVQDVAAKPSIATQTEPVKFSDVLSLKPALWGMSIDLLKAWKWLRHSLRPKQQAMPHFLKTASALNRLWRDPVWSKVIATGITAGIAALVWYFHTQNPLPGATPTPSVVPLAPTNSVTPGASHPATENPRVFTTKTIAELMGFYEDRTALQGDAFMNDEVGKWINTDGIVHDIQPGNAISVILDVGKYAVTCSFNNKLWQAKLSTFRDGDTMKIVGNIEPGQNVGINISKSV